MDHKLSDLITHILNHINKFMNIQAIIDSRLRPYHAHDVQLKSVDLLPVFIDKQNVVTISVVMLVMF